MYYVKYAMFVKSQFEHSILNGRHLAYNSFKICMFFEFLLLCMQNFELIRHEIVLDIKTKTFKKQNGDASEYSTGVLKHAVYYTFYF